MLFFHSELLTNSLVLNTEESGHLVRVLRKGKGEEIQITDGKGTIAKATIVDPNPKKCQVEIIKKETFPADPYYIHIAVSPTKNIDRIGWFIEKAVEIGIHEISFPICKHSERKVLKVDKLIAKAISAMKQSLSPFLPKINEATSFSGFIKSIDNNGQKFIAHLGNENTPELISKSHRDANYCVLIGPEGDFDSMEMKEAIQEGFEMIKLGNKRLRTETAALHACSLLNGINYD